MPWPAIESAMAAGEEFSARGMKSGGHRMGSGKSCQRSSGFQVPKPENISRGDSQPAAVMAESAPAAHPLPAHDWSPGERPILRAGCHFPYGEIRSGPGDQSPAIATETVGSASERNHLPSRPEVPKPA